MFHEQPPKRSRPVPKETADKKATAPKDMPPSAVETNKGLPSDEKPRASPPGDNSFAYQRILSHPNVLGSPPGDSSFAPQRVVSSADILGPPPPGFENMILEFRRQHQPVANSHAPPPATAPAPPAEAKTEVED